MSKYEIPFLISSDIKDGALNKSTDGSKFLVQLDDPLQIPSDAKSCYVGVEEATIWNNIPNILDGVNNHFYIDEGKGFVDVTIPQGLYDLPGLQSAIDREYVALGGTTGLFTLIGDDSTQRVVIQINVAAVQIDFTQANTPKDILGFNSQLVPPAPSVGFYTQIADNVANFNTLEYLLIHSDISIQGIRINSSYNQTISKVSINSPPGSQILYTPFNAPRSSCFNLIGQIKKTIRFWLTDQNNQPVNTGGENWSCRLLIEYTI